MSNNKLLKKFPPSKLCEWCKEIFFKQPRHSLKTWTYVVKFCSQKCHGEWKSKYQRGENANSWKGNSSHDAVHHWIYFNYGKANQCDNRIKQILEFTCSKKFNKFHWAQIHGTKMERERDNFYMLCTSCHSRYDHDENTVKKRRINMLKRYPEGYRHTNETKHKIGLAGIGNKYRLGKIPWNKGLRFNRDVV